MRKNKYSSYSSSPRRKLGLRSILLILLIGLPLLLLIAELIARGVVLATGPAGQVAKGVSIAQAYTLKLQDANGRVYPGLPISGKLQVRRSPLMGYELVPSQSSDHWQINDQGFRQDSSVATEKPAGEIRVFLVGNSTAFSYMAASNQQALAFKLEKLLNDRVRLQNQQPNQFKPKELPYFADQIEASRALPPRIRDGSYRVIAAAVPGYNSSNELALIVHRVMGFHPDALIVLDGYEDLRSPSQESAHELVNLEQLLQDPMAQYRQQVSQNFNAWLDSFYLMQALRRWVLPPQAPPVEGGYQIFSAEQISNDPKEVRSRIERYRYNIQQMAKLTAGIPTIVAIQPEITGKQDALTPEETELLKRLGSDYTKRAEKAYAELESKILSYNLPNAKLLSFYQAFSNFKKQAFQDPIHLTDAANDFVADRLYTNLADAFAVQPASPTPQSESLGR
ncbi:hypothetical protein V2H45_00990 [Tumidithrix elongata RA019]|uniref:SGNH hydrolase-type esterase domain-containing protein n=1 Tax=Tumidithrix elongata BACA0141 TaxID=2716417 RepID=A0AAW9PVV3_9CYAN|nr:hypothetical protein [Tumidithrix elongata RA019]